MFLVSLLFVFLKMFDIKKSPTARSRAVRPLGYFAVLLSHNHFTSVLDVDALLRGVAFQLAAVQVVPYTVDSTHLDTVDASDHLNSILRILNSLLQSLGSIVNSLLSSSLVGLHTLGGVDGLE